MGFAKFLLYFFMGMLLLFYSIVLGDQAPWYFAWSLGTVMIVLIAVSGAVLFEAQEKETKSSSDHIDE